MIRNAAPVRCARPVRDRLLLAAAVVFTACHDDAGVPAAGFSIRDSAGIVIVENVAPAWGEGAGYRLADAPRVSIGVREGEEPYQFTQIDAATRLSDGSIVIADSRQVELRLFDAEGRYVRTIARRGDGPGELAQLRLIQRTGGDTLVVLNMLQLDFFAGRGGHLRSVPLMRDGDGFRFRPQFRFADGRLLADRVGAMTPRQAPRPGHFEVSELARDHYLTSEDGQHARLAISISQGLYYEHVLPDRSIYFGTPPFSPVPVSAVAGNLFYHGEADRYELGVYEPDGTLIRLIRLAVDPMPVTRDDIQAYRRERLARASEQMRPNLERTLDVLPYPDVRPAYSRLLVDDGGRIWLRDDTPSGDPQRWRLFAPNGEYLGDVAVPTGLELLEVGRDYVLGRTIDEYDVPGVQLWELLSGSSRS